MLSPGRWGFHDLGKWSWQGRALDCVPRPHLAHAEQPTTFEEPGFVPSLGHPYLGSFCVTFLICSCQFISEVAKGIQAQPRGRLEGKLCLSVPLGAEELTPWRTLGGEMTAEGDHPNTMKMCSLKVLE